jgi:hypothetical protein
VTEHVAPRTHVLLKRPLKLNMLRKNIIVRLIGSFLPSCSIALADQATDLLSMNFFLFLLIEEDFDDLFFSACDIV